MDRDFVNKVSEDYFNLNRNFFLSNKEIKPGLMVTVISSLLLSVFESSKLTPKEVKKVLKDLLDAYEDLHDQPGIE